MSQIEVDKIIPQSGTALQVGENGDTITVPAGATLDASNATTTLPSTVVTTTGTQTLTNKSIVATQLTGTVANARLTGSGAITINGASVALGGSTTIATGLSWQSTIVTASTLTAVSGNGYWINTTSNACTITLPSNPSLGDEIVFVDYARKWGTNAITINQNSKKYQGNTSPNPVYNSDGQSVSIVYSDATQGWIPTVDDDVTLETPQTYASTQLVLAGGGSGGYNPGNAYGSGGGGAGGYRTTASGLTPGAVYTVTVGQGGTSTTTASANGTDSSIIGTGVSITSTGGGRGAHPGNASGSSGGSGGGAGNLVNRSGASGNTPSTSPSQGNNGGNSGADPNGPGGGGGGAGADGANATNTAGGNGGAGASSSITGSAVTRGGGGGGATYGGGSAGTGGSGGGGDGQASTGNGSAGTDGLGAGGGGAGANDSSAGKGGDGGNGVVIISMADAKYSGTVTGSPTVATGVSGQTVLTFTGSGSYTA